VSVVGIVVRQDLALAWSDSETFGRDGIPVGHANKLVVNASACFASVGAGLAGLSRTVAEVVADARTLDEAAARMGAPLRAKAERMARDPRMDPFTLASHVELSAGWSAAFRCLVGYEARGDALFMPRLVPRAASPWVPELNALDPEDPWAVADLARCQLAKLREDLPDARGGVLTVAVIRPGEVRSGPLFCFEDEQGAWLWPGMCTPPEHAKELTDG